MITLDLKDLFLLNSSTQVNEIFDNFFDIQYEQIEQQLEHGSYENSAYAGENLKEEALNTSWYDYLLMLRVLIQRNATMIDLGSGYSKGTLLSLALNEDRIISIELVKERIAQACSAAIKKDLRTDFFHQGDALNFDLSLYDTYFIYQPVSSFLSKLLDKISNNPGSKIWAVESHGDLISRLEIDSRFTFKEEVLQLSSKRHHPSLFEYITNSSEKNSVITTESEAYESTCALIGSTLASIGEIKWLTGTSTLEIDYLDNLQTISINNRRFNSKNNSDEIIEFDPVLENDVQEYLKLTHIEYNGKVQKIMKHIIHPKNTIELSISGIVSMPLSFSYSF